jgi:hypothetical protein
VTERRSWRGAAAPSWSRVAKEGKINRRFAAVVVVAVLAITGCTTGQLSGGGSASPSLAAPSLTPTPTSTPSPAASTGVPLVPGGPLAAGTYTMPLWDTNCSERQPGCSPSPAHDAIRVSFTVPDGWEGGVDPPSIGIDTPDAPGLLFGRGAWLLTDPCTKAMHAVPPDVAVGPSVEDFANALADHPLLDVTDPVDVTLAGYSGKYLDLQVPADLSRCEVYRPFDPGLFAQDPSHQWHLWILDVDGLRFVVQSMDYPGTSKEHRKELKAIVDSITFEP